MTRAKLAGPTLVDSGAPVASGCDDRSESGGRGRLDFDGAASIVAKLTGNVADTDEFCRAENGRRSERELELEAASDR